MFVVTLVVSSTALNALLRDCLTVMKVYYLCIPLYFLSQTKYGTFDSVAIVRRSFSCQCTFVTNKCTIQHSIHDNTATHPHAALGIQNSLHLSLSLYIYTVIYTYRQHRH